MTKQRTGHDVSARRRGVAALATLLVALVMAIAASPAGAQVCFDGIEEVRVVTL